MQIVFILTYLLQSLLLLLSSYVENKIIFFFFWKKKLVFPYKVKDNLWYDIIYYVCIKGYLFHIHSGSSQLRNWITANTATTKQQFHLLCLEFIWPDLAIITYSHSEWKHLQDRYTYARGWNAIHYMVIFACWSPLKMSFALARRKLSVPGPSGCDLLCSLIYTKGMLVTLLTYYGYMAKLGQWHWPNSSIPSTFWTYRYGEGNAQLIGPALTASFWDPTQAHP